MDDNIGRNAPCYCGSGAKYKKCCLAKDEAQRKPHTGEDAVIICMPTRGQIAYETQVGIEQNMAGVKYALIRVGRKPVVEARNILAAEALKAWRSNPFAFTPRETFVLWLDDDAMLLPQLVPTMLRAMHEPSMKGVDALFGWFCARAAFAEPIAYRQANVADSYPKVGVDCQPGDIVDIDAAGFHAVLMRPRLLEKVGADPFTPESDEGEDIAFCRRARTAGARLVVATALAVPHVDPRDGMAYLPGMPAMLTDGNTLRRVGTEHADALGRAKAAELRRYGGALDGYGAEAEATHAAMLAEIDKRRNITAGC